MALTCFCVAFLCVGMALGGATSDFYTFTIMWFLHLIGGSMYTACTVIVPVARYSSDGEDCAKLSPVNGDRLDAVYTMHAILYLFYVGGMLSITYFSFLKKYLQERKLPPISVILLVIVVFAIPQSIVVRDGPLSTRRIQLGIQQEGGAKPAQDHLSSKKARCSTKTSYARGVYR